MPDKNILVVEDEGALLRAIKDKLELRGFTAFPVASADEAFEVIKKNRIDLIWLDHYLPGKSGLEFFAIIKKDDKYKNIPVFLISNSADVGDLYSYINMGVDKYYVKMDSTLDSIIDDIREYLEEKK